jgi:hypothetical protein
MPGEELEYICYSHTAHPVRLTILAADLAATRVNPEVCSDGSAHATSSVPAVAGATSADAA